MSVLFFYIQIQCCVTFEHMKRLHECSSFFEYVYIFKGTSFFYRMVYKKLNIDSSPFIPWFFYFKRCWRFLIIFFFERYNEHAHILASIVFTSLNQVVSWFELYIALFFYYNIILASIVQNEFLNFIKSKGPTFYGTTTKSTVIHLARISPFKCHILSLTKR